MAKRRAAGLDRTAKEADMPKRVIDFDALWASDKIASCPGWAQAEYAWLYGLADASGSFELTNLRVIWGRVAAVRKDLTIERLEEIFQEFIARGLLFTWEAGGKRYGHWTGSDVPGRLPPPSWRLRLERLAPPLPKRELEVYMGRFSSRRQPVFGDEAAAPPQVKSEPPHAGRTNGAESAIAASATAQLSGSAAETPQLNLGLETAQAQEWDKDWDWNKEKGREDTPGCVSAARASEGATNEQQSESAATRPGTTGPEDLLQIYERERGNLPAVAGLTPQRRRQCTQRIRAGLSREEFAAAVRCAAATPFLAGEGARGWRASFDWLIANDRNVRKGIEGAYDSAGPRGSAPGGSGGRVMDRALYSEIHVGAGPIAAHSGAHPRPEVIERMRAREAARGSP
jgi:hypothetical protein